MSSKPRIILGLMAFGPAEGVPMGARLHAVSDLTAALDKFQARGFTELDTARGYGCGQQEGYTRQAGWKERGLSVGTKVFPMPPGTHAPESITREFEKSLAELGTDCVDIAYLHAPDRSVPFAATLEAMNALHQSGKFRQLGLSNYAAFEVAEMVTLCTAKGWVRPTVYQGVYNCLQRGIEPELLAACRRYGLSFIAYSPTAGGLLSGKFTSPTDVPAEGRFSNQFLGGWARQQVFKQGMFEALAVLRGVAERNGVGMMEVGLRWIRHHSKLDLGGGDGVVVGVSRLEHLDQNLDALEKGPLDDELLGAVERAYAVARAEEGPYWFGELKYGYDTKEVLFGEK
ncbi:aflatoxin B1 aldehyde reductase member 2 [Echria macrotheca]|uniref:Aflatoxin B1 aldehyde reductase member 2 n=1 Tax=Echria macrotheca TaxID=438768 RepID=A0AAJ0B8L2_9PEZI|nr:aflatoxin B1 aldehyde reductase member 2 [Echria macrotheca]